MQFSLLVQRKTVTSITRQVERYMLHAAECPEVKFFITKKMVQVAWKVDDWSFNIQNKFTLI